MTPKILEAKFIAGASTLASLPAPTFGEVAFAGRSNVGKSSLLNALTQRKNLVRTSRTPGLTRQINFFEVKVSLGGEPFKLHMVDLPGYGFAQVGKKEQLAWGKLMDGYLGQRPTLRAVAIIVDVRRGVEEDDLQLLRFMQPEREKVSRIPPTTLLLATKVDRVSKSERKPALLRVRDGAKRAGVMGSPIGCSGATGEGTSELWAAIRDIML